MSHFHRGQLIVCIAENDWTTIIGDRTYVIDPKYAPRKGSVYHADGYNDWGHVWLVELPDSTTMTTCGVKIKAMEPWGWNPDNFRPVNEAKIEAGMTILRGILKDQKATEDA